MNDVVFYRTEDGRSSVIELFDTLKEKGDAHKSERIARTKVLAYVEALSRYGTLLGMPQARYLEDGIWELRPLRYRIFYFHWKEGTYVLLSWFYKRTQKTPRSEIERAKRNRDDFVRRFGRGI